MPLTPGNGYMQFATKTVAFTGAANLGAVGNVPIFTVTGDVLVAVLTAFCTETLVGATATLALGVTGSTSFFIGATTATDIAANDIWVDTTPTETNALAVPAGFKDIFVTDNIVGTVATAAITDGTIRFDCYYMPLSAGSSLVAA